MVCFLRSLHVLIDFDKSKNMFCVLTATINVSSGQRLCRIWNTFYTAGASANMVYDKSNVANAKITNIQTMLNGKALQQFPYVPGNRDDFMVARWHIFE